jgi:uncharacterized membrane protein YbhN (UPF0104 family)
MKISADRLSPANESDTDGERPAEGQGRRRAWAIRLGKWMITAVVIAAVAFAARESVSKWQEQSTATRITLADVRWGWLGVSAVSYAISLVPAGLVLRRALAALHQPVALRLVMAAQLVGHLGKYVPGKAMVIVLRASILSRGATKISIKLSAIAVIIETLNLIAVGAALALLLVMVLDTPAWIQWGSGLMALGATVGTLPPVLRFVLSRRLRIPTRRSSQNAPEIATMPLDWTARDWWAAWGWCAISWFFTGISMTAVVLALVPLAIDQSLVSLTLICSAASMLAFVAGFLSLLPGGVGVRETVLATLLGPIIGPGPALLSAVVARLVQLAVESILAAAIWGMMQRRRIRPTNQFAS